MSEEAGGLIVACGAVVAGGAVIAALAAGGLVLGAGYLVCRGGYQAVKSCKSAWDKHLAELERERKERLEQLQKADEAQVQTIQNNLSKWALESEELLRQNEMKILEEFDRKRAQIIEDQCELSVNSTSWKRLIRLEDELKDFDSGLSVAASIKASGNDRAEYRRQLEKEQEQLRQETGKPSRKAVNIEDLVKILITDPPTKKPSLAHLSNVDKQLAIFRSQIAGLLFLSESEREIVRAKAKQFEISLRGKPSEIELNFESKKDELKNLLIEAREMNEKKQKTWQEMQEIYFSLYDRYTTATQDPVLKELIENPLGDLHKILEEAKRRISEPQEDPAACLVMLKESQQKFENQVEALFRAHQRNLNQQVKNTIVKVIEGLGYGNVKEEMRNNKTTVTSSSIKRHKGAELCFSLDDDGYLSIDISRKGFKNQSECTKEFDRIQQALQDHGVYVELRKHKKTWLPEMVNFISAQLENMGYTKAGINTVDIEGGIRITATDTEKKIAEITIDEKTGECTETFDSEVELLKAVISPEDEEEYDDERDGDQERLQT